MIKTRTFVYYWLPLIVYCTAIFVQSSFSSPDFLPHIRHVDKVEHFAAYAILGALFLRAYRTLSLRNRTLLLIVLSILSSALYGVSDEFHQSFVKSRRADLIDILADFIGSVAGVMAYFFYRKKPDDVK